MILLALSLARAEELEGTKYGDWLSRAAEDPYLDLIPPVVSEELRRRFGNWWTTSWKELSLFVLSRFVVRQHMAMAYVKTATGNRCLLETDGPRIIAAGRYDRIGMGNPRFRSAVQILTDLAFLAATEDGPELTSDGHRLLEQALAMDSER
jgi:hypothetical protein